MKKIIAIDDQTDILYSLKRVLEPKYEVTTSTSGAEALEKLKKETYDLVLLDLMMPGMDGWAVLAEIKTDPKIKNDIPIIILTAMTDKVNKAMSAGQVKDYVEKPINGPDLLSRIQKVIGS